MDEKLTNFLVEAIKNNGYSVVYNKECCNKPDIRVVGDRIFAKVNYTGKLTVEIPLSREDDIILNKLAKELYNEI